MQKQINKHTNKNYQSCSAFRKPRVDPMRRFFSTNVPQSQAEMLVEFYRRELLRGTKIIQAEPGTKRPMFRDGAKQPEFKDPESIVVQILKDNLHVMLCWKAAARSTRSVVLDFDLHKLGSIEERNRLKNKLLSLSKVLDWTIIQTPSGGFHIYFQAESSELLSYTTIIDGISKSLIPKIDYLGGSHRVMGPNGKDRLIINLSRNEALPKTPWWLEPIKNNKAECLAFGKRLNASPLSYWLKGSRASGMLQILENHPLTDDELREYNKLFCEPPKTEEDLKFSVFNCRPKAGKDLSHFKNPATVGVVFCSTKKIPFILEKDALYWRPSNINYAGKLLLDQGIPIEGTRLDNFIRRNLAVEGVDASRRAWETTLIGHPLYYSNRACLFIKTEGGCEIQEINPMLLRNHFVATPMQTAYNLTPEEEKLALLALSTEKTLYQLVEELVPTLYKFLSDRTTYKTEGLRREFREAALDLLAVSFMKNTKSYHKEIKVFVAIIIAGDGGSGKSVFIKLLAALVGFSLGVTSDLAKLKDRFDLSKMIDATLVTYPEQDSTYGKKARGVIGKFFSGPFKALTGGDLLSAELKFDALLDFISYAFHVVTTNEPIILSKASAAEYASAKRRAYFLFFNKIRPVEDQDPNFAEKLISEAGSLLPLIFASKIEERMALANKMKNYDLEKLIYDNHEYESYTSQTCSFYGFTKEVLSPKATNKQVTVNLTFNELVGIYIQYIVLRLGSLYQRTLKSFNSEILDCFNSYDCTNRIFKKTVTEDFPLNSQYDSLSANHVVTLQGILNSRGAFIEGYKPLNWQLETRKQPARDPNSGKFSSMIEVSVAVALNVTLNLDVLETLPGFIFPKVVERAIDKLNQNQQKAKNISEFEQMEIRALNMLLSPLKEKGLDIENQEMLKTPLAVNNPPIDKKPQRGRPKKQTINILLNKVKRPRGRPKKVKKLNDPPKNPAPEELEIKKDPPPFTGFRERKIRGYNKTSTDLVK